jgi:hypothetical protein
MSILELERYPLGLEVSPCPKGVFFEVGFLKLIDDE